MQPALFGVEATGGGTGGALVFMPHLSAHQEASQVHLLLLFIRSGAAFSESGALWPVETEALTTELCPAQDGRSHLPWLLRNWRIWGLVGFFSPGAVTKGVADSTGHSRWVFLTQDLMYGSRC